MELCSLLRRPVGLPFGSVLRPAGVLPLLFRRLLRAHYVKRGFVAWFDFHFGKGTFDPNFAYYRHHYGDNGWEKNLREYFAGRTKGDIPRPPRTLVKQTAVINSITKDKTVNVNVTKNISVTNIQNVNAIAPVTKIHDTTITGLSSLGKEPASGKEAEPFVLKVEKMPKEQHTEVIKAIKQFKDAGLERRQIEAKIIEGGHAPFKPSDPPHEVKFTPPKTVAILPVGLKPPPPPLPKPPVHVEKPIPLHEPPKPVKPPPKK
jgi:hypothetical protein